MPKSEKTMEKYIENAIMVETPSNAKSIWSWKLWFILSLLGWCHPQNNNFRFYE